MTRAIFCALLLVNSAFHAASTQVTPIQKVIQMLNDMKAKGTQEKQDEEVRFASYKGFCENTSADKTKSISSAKEAIEQLAADIQKAESDASQTAKQMAQFDKDMDIWTADKNEAIAIRKEAHATFVEANEDYLEAIDAVARAVTVLKAGPTDKAGASLLQISSLKVVSPKAKRVLMSFLQQDPVSALLQDAANYDLPAAPEANAFESSSGGVITMVEDLGEKFKDERNELEKKEGNERHSHNMQVQDLTNQIEGATKERASAAASKAASEQAKAEATGDKSETTAQLAEDEKFLSDLTAECEQKAADFEKRQELRQGELDAIQKAIDIMSSDSVSGSGDKHLPSLVQQDATALVQFLTTTHSAVQRAAANFLSDNAQRSGSRVLALLAVKVSEDPFKKVTKMIKDMIVKLTEEATEEAEHQGFCNTELGTNKQTRDSKTEDAQSLQAEMEQLTADIAKLGEEIAELGEAVAASDAAVAQATADRTAEKEKNTATIADAKAGQAAVQQALQVLKEFYDKAATATALTQLSMPGSPETFDKPYTGMAGGGVLGMLEVCESDFARLGGETSASEADAAAAFGEFTSDSAVDKAVKETNSKNKAGQRTRKESALASASKDLKSTQEELEAAMAYYEKLKPSCVDAGESYEERVARREEEIQSLKEAMQILSGDSL